MMQARHARLAALKNKDEILDEALNKAIHNGLFSLEVDHLSDSKKVELIAMGYVITNNEKYDGKKSYIIYWENAE